LLDKLPKDTDTAEVVAGVLGVAVLIARNAGCSKEDLLQSTKEFWNEMEELENKGLFPKKDPSPELKN
jgi:ribosomal protein S3